MLGHLFQYTGAITSSILGPSWAHKVSTWGTLGAKWGPHGGHMETHVAHRVATWGTMGATRAPLGGICGHIGAPLGSNGHPLGAPRVPNGSPMAPKFKALH